jgi:hypothetical protein
MLTFLGSTLNYFLIYLFETVSQNEQSSAFHPDGIRSDRSDGQHVPETNGPLQRTHSRRRAGLNNKIILHEHNITVEGLIFRVIPLLSVDECNFLSPTVERQIRQEQPKNFRQVRIVASKEKFPPAR